MNRCVVWTSYGLDGIGAYLALSWSLKSTLDVQVTSTKHFRSDFEKWSAQNNSKDFKIFILNLDVSSCTDLIDTFNVIIFDSHDSHIENRVAYKNAKITGLQNLNGSSHCTSDVIVGVFKPVISAEKMQLLQVISNYYKDPTDVQGRLLNLYYWSINKDRLNTFIERYKDGFNGFDKEQRNNLTIQVKRTAHIVSTLDTFGIRIPFKGKQYLLISAFGSTSYDDILTSLISRGADIAMVVNLDGKSVYVRRSKDCELPLHKFMSKLCNGGGNADYAGGNITQKFLEFTKNLIPHEL